MKLLPPYLDQRPSIVALAGPNGAGKSSFYYAHLQPTGLRLINADVLARDLNVDPATAVQLADAVRRELVTQRESFVFETVFSDPVGEKRKFLREAVEAGYTVVLIFIGISGPKVSEERVAMRVSRGGHDVPAEKLQSRFPRTLSNLTAAIAELPHVWVYDNDDLGSPYRLVARFEDGKVIEIREPAPRWLRPLAHPQRNP